MVADMDLSPRPLPDRPVRTAQALEQGATAREIAGPLWQRLHHGVHAGSRDRFRDWWGCASSDDLACSPLSATFVANPAVRHAEARVRNVADNEVVGVAVARSWASPWAAMGVRMLDWYGGCCGWNGG